jgi:CRP-like cAMP-binding protein
MPRSTTSTATLSRLPERLSAQLLAATKSCHLRAGDTLFAAGDSGDGCYRLERGLLKVIITSPRDEERILAILGPGEIAGELSIIDEHPRSASVIAVKDCELSFINQKNFEKCTKQEPGYLSIPGERAGVIDGRRRARKREQALSDWKRRGLVTRSSGFYSLNDNTTLKRYAADEGPYLGIRQGKTCGKSRACGTGVSFPRTPDGRGCAP